MNRSGHIGTLLMVFGALILVGNALMVMQNFDGGISKVRSELRLLSDKSNVNHKAVELAINKTVYDAIVSSKDSVNFEKSFNESLKATAEKERVREGNTNLYGKIALGDYSLRFDGQSYVLTVNDIFEKTNIENNEVIYTYNIKVIFDKTKVISIEEDL